MSLWNPEKFKGIIRVVDRNFIWVQLEVIGHREVINMVNIYAPNRVVGRRCLCHKLEDLMVRERNDSWIVSGDFNIPLEETEKLGGSTDNM